MLYKNNNKKELDMNIFENPPSEYRGAPFWSWNALLDADRLKQQIQCFKEMGFGGFYMHPRGGMETEYLSEDYFKCIAECIEYAKLNGMKACLYDEDRWPSGFAGGLVTKTPKYRQRALFITADETSLPNFDISKERAVEEGKPYLVGCYDVEFNQDGYLKSYRRINPTDKALYNKYYAYSKTEQPSGRYNFQTFADIMQEEAVESFINLTHNKYYDKFGTEYNDTVPTIFSDEPRHIPLRQMTEDLRGTAVYYWTYSLEEKFKAEYGYDIVERLPKLVWDEKDVHSYERYDFFNLTTKLTKEAFFEKIHNVTEKQGLMYCGHLMMEDELLGQLSWGGDAMRLYPCFDIPGIDMLYDNIELLNAKQVQSVVRQYGKEAMLSELYGVTGWDFDFKCLKMQGDWQAALGVSVRVPHLAMYSMKGCAKRDYPASFNHQAPWYQEFKYLEDHYARLNCVFSRSKDIAEVAVIHPIESMMLSLTTKEKSGEDIKNQEESIQQLIRTLLYANIDFDFINEANLLSQNTDCSSKLTVGKMQYSAVLIPPLKTLRKTTVELLEKFISNGGKVIFTGGCPQYLDGRLSDAVKKLYGKSAVIPEKAELIAALEDLRRVKIRADGAESKKIYRLSEDNGDYWLFVAAASKMGKSSQMRSSIKPEKTVVEVKGEFGVTVYNTLTGKTEKADYIIKGGKTYIYKDWYANDSLLLKLTKEITDKKQNENIALHYDTIVVEDCRYSLEEDNCAVLDICSVSTDGISYNGKKYVLEQNSILCERLGITPTDAQPYIIKNPQKYNVYARFEFECEAEIDGLSLALERAEEAKIYFNSKEIEAKAGSYYVDRDIKKVRLTRSQKGKNTIETVIPISMVRQLEACYILGDFCAYVKGYDILLKPRKTDKISFEPVCEQGMAFYSGNIAYKASFYSDDCLARISVPVFTAPCIKVMIDGKSAGLIAFSPFSVTVPLKKGKHEIEFICYGNRNNTFGPIHNKRIADPDYYITPLAWYFKGESFSSDYCFQKTGILTNPVIKLYKERKM